MLSHIVHPYVHQFTGIKCTSAKMRGSGGMCGLSSKGKVNPCVGKRITVLDSIESRRVPGYGRAYIIK